MDASGFTGGFHARRDIDRIAPDIVLQSLATDHTSHDRTAVQADT